MLGFRPMAELEAILPALVDIILAGHTHQEVLECREGNDFKLGQHRQVLSAQAERGTKHFAVVFTAADIAQLSTPL